MTMIELDTEREDSIQFEAFSVRSLPMHHNAESLAYRFTDRQGRSVVYSGDTDYTDNLVYLSGGADLLICEAALPDERKVEGHLTPSLAGDIASRAGVAQLVLTHFYPECDRVDIRAQCRKTYRGPLVLAKDLMQIELGAV
jgi:ribonuclease BN (tRNA processing enzyme)